MVIFKLKDLLAKNNVSQKELSKITGIRPGTISDYCTNTAKSISLENMNLICTALNCNIGDFIVFINEKSENSNDNIYENIQIHIEHLKPDRIDVNNVDKIFIDYSKIVNNYSKLVDEYFKTLKNPNIIECKRGVGKTSSLEHILKDIKDDENQEVTDLDIV